MATPRPSVSGARRGATDVWRLQGEAGVWWGPGSGGGQVWPWQMSPGVALAEGFGVSPARVLLGDLEGCEREVHLVSLRLRVVGAGLQATLGRDLPGGPVVKTLWSQYRGPVRSLVQS